MTRAAAGVARRMSKGFTLMALLPFYVAMGCTAFIDQVNGFTGRS